MTNAVAEAATELQISAATLTRLAIEARDSDENPYPHPDPETRFRIAANWQSGAARVSRLARRLMGVE